MSLHSLPLVISLLISQAALAQPDPCPDARTQVELNHCADKAWRSADAELNRVYRVLIDLVEDQQAVRLRAAQRAWLPFRDAHCEVEASTYEGGSMRPMVLSFCMADVTRQRTAQLQAHLDSLNL
jgi:uncharacterized protein YecT (DUF1311 family)